jgi:preprotein translocase subunit SecE
MSDLVIYVLCFVFFGTGLFALLDLLFGRVIDKFMGLK